MARRARRESPSWQPGGEPAGLPAWINDKSFDLAHHVSEVLEAYDQLSEIDRRVLESEEFRTVASKDISMARTWLFWARRNLPHEAEPVALVCVFIAQRYFVVSHGAEPNAPIFPTRRFIRTMLGVSEVRAWLSSQGASLPSWLR